MLNGVELKEGYLIKIAGRYVAPIPWKKQKMELGNSYDNAYKFFLRQEKRWYQDAEHKKMSDDFMAEYLEMGHMSEIPQDKQRDRSGRAYYIPYLSVIRRDSLTTKLRNVFNASAASQTASPSTQQSVKVPLNRPTSLTSSQGSGNSGTPTLLTSLKCSVRYSSQLRTERCYSQALQSRRDPQGILANTELNYNVNPINSTARSTTRSTRTTLHSLLS